MEIITKTELKIDSDTGNIAISSTGWKQLFS